MLAKTFSRRVAHLGNKRKSDRLALKFAEEAGEVVQAYNKGQKKLMLEEAGDVLARLANLLEAEGYSLEQAMKVAARKYNK